MRILIWETVRKELESSVAFNLALFRAIDPRIVTHRPRDPEKVRLMSELGLEIPIASVVEKVSSKTKRNSSHSAKRAPVQPDPTDLECGPQE